MDNDFAPEPRHTCTARSALLTTGMIPERPLGYADIEATDRHGRVTRELVPIWPNRTSLSRSAYIVRFKLLGVEGA